MFKLYIAGKITGDPHYSRKFSIAENSLRNAGFTVLNPAALPEGMKPSDYIRICLAMLDSADGVALLDDWRNSAGAQIEQSIAAYIGLPSMSAREWQDCLKVTADG